MPTEQKATDMKRNLLCALIGMLACAPTGLAAQSGVYYTGTRLSNPMRHDGGLSPVVGVHNIQTMRANRVHPAAANGGW